LNIVHGTWIPDETDEFAQRGAFYLWVETDTPARTTRSRVKNGAGTPPAHPRQLTRAELEAFLLERLGLRHVPPDAMERAIADAYFLLPSAHGAPLPSVELARYVDEEAPDEFALAPWQVCCYRLDRPIPALHDIYLRALHDAEEFQLGADLLFWHRYTRELKAIIARDHYIPALKYRELEPVQGKRKKAKAELYPAWEFVSAPYEAAIERYAACLPPVCAAVAATPDAVGALYDAETLLRHAAECLLYDAVTTVPTTAKLEQQVAGSLLDHCLFPQGHTYGYGYGYAFSSVRQPSGPSLEEYKGWAAWREGLIGAHTAAAFALCFRLREAPPDDVDDWRVEFLMASKRDPSLKLSLADYWSLDGAARAAVREQFGADVERTLLLALGSAARIYPKVWEGLETAQPAGFRLDLEEAFAFLHEDAWVLEDAGYTVIVPAWYTPQGRRRAKIKLKTSARSGNGNGTPAKNGGYFSLDELVDYQYQLSIDGQPVAEEEWRQLVEAKTSLVQFRGQWMELDRDAMRGMLEYWQARGEGRTEMSLMELLRVASGDEDDVELDHDDVLRDMLSRLRDKSAFAPVDDPPNLCGVLRDYQKRGVAWLQYLESLGLNPLLADDMGLGKCLGPDALIAVNGSVEKAESLWNSYATEIQPDGEGFWAQPATSLLVPALDEETGKMTVAPVRRLYRQYVRERLRKVTLEDGSSVTMTRRHQLLTNDGWTNALCVGSYVCVPAAIPGDGDVQDPDLITFLAWQIAEGYELKDLARVTITQKDRTTLESLRQALERVGQRYGLKINCPAIRSTSSKTCHYLVVNSRAYQRFLESQGYEWGKRSKDKSLPSFILRAHLDTVRLFLRHYFDAEGAALTSMRSLEISTVLPLLIQQLSFLLRRLGIWLRVSCKQKHATNGSGTYGPYYIGTIGGNGARRFLQEVGFGNPRKQRLLEKICEHTGNTNIEGIPASAAVAHLVRTTGLPIRHFGMHNTVYTNGSQQFSRTSLQRVVNGCDHIISGAAEQEYRRQKTFKWTTQTLEKYARLDAQQVIETRERIQRLLDQEVFYCRIKEIEEFEYDGWVYDFEVAKHHNFVANNMLCHNTVQVIAHLVGEKNETAATGPTLLIAPTSVLGNWRKEFERFAPHLRTLTHHGPARIKDAREFAAARASCDVVITSFALARLDEKLLRGQEWRRVVVDEAQNIKNPQSAQAKAIAKLPARRRVALTGTPVENRLLDLWSIFNFLNPGYLGKEGQFRKSFEAPIQKDNDLDASATLKRLVEPFILRRVKTDKSIIDDLPDKIEQKVYCPLTHEQASLYEAVVKDVAERLESAEGMERRGLILSTLMKLKQVCNHPAQFLQDGSDFSGERSHKLGRLGEMIEEALESGESLLVFTQFTEIGEALERYIRQTLRRDTYYLHGGTSAKRREEMVAEFQDPETEPSVFILSLRAGGVGITLTKANHVFHFDRWWNPAVEDQASDRAFRIGQRKNVFVHKFVTLGTMEERIDAMIEDKKRLSSSIVGADEAWLTELDNDTFKSLIALRRDAILG